MYTKEDIEKAKQYLDNEGYGTGSNFTLNAVANLMAEYAAKNCVIPAVSVAKHPLPRPLEAWKNARNMELSEYIEWHLEQERRGNAR